MAIEKPEYRVLSSSNGIELREYSEHWLAECSVEDVEDLLNASSRAFNRLFNYISGQNEPGQKIAMTSPVAFIWLPRLRSAPGNLSNGKRGSFTTT